MGEYRKDSLQQGIVFYISTIKGLLSRAFTALRSITVSYVATVAIMKQSVLDEITKRAISLSRNIAAVGAYSLLSNDLLGLDNIVCKSKSSNEDVEYITILDTDMKALVHSNISMRGKKFKSPEGRTVEAIDKGYMIRE